MYKILDLKHVFSNFEETVRSLLKLPKTSLASRTSKPDINTEIAWYNQCEGFFTSRIIFQILMQPNPGRAFGENRIGYTIILVNMYWEY